MKSRGHRLPRLQLRPRPRGGDRDGHRPRAGDGLARATASCPTALDLIAIPGGFSYGDYLRSGAMAARSPIMRAVVEAAGKRRAGARRVQRLPGADRGGAAARRADAQRRPVLRLPRRSALKVENSQSIFTSALCARARRSASRSPTTTAITRPTRTTLDRLEGEGRVAFRYADEVNGSARDIAGCSTTPATCSA